MYHIWVEWDMWDKRTRRYGLLDKKIIFEKNKKNGMVMVLQAKPAMLENVQKDIEKWIECKGVYPKDAGWRPEVKLLDEITTRSKIIDLVGNQGEMISFGHLEFEMKFGIKLPD
jgi:hypothetical protein